MISSRFEYLYFCKYRLRVWLISDNFIFRSKYLYFSKYRLLINCILENFVFPQLEEFQPDVVLQQDDAPPHGDTIVRNSLNDHFTGRWIGRGGPIPWPLRSPDITPLDFFLWGFVKDNVYRRRVSNVDDLKARITTAIASVDADMLAGTWREIEYRLDILRATKRAHVEVH
ncbi:hypothetical protein X975_15179, partial [Stegodyphus mimosarum]